MRERLWYTVIDPERALHPEYIAQKIAQLCRRSTSRQDWMFNAAPKEEARGVFKIRGGLEKRHSRGERPRS
jgi:hypothetical protein